MDNLKFHFHCQYDEKDSIGKRYRRQDAIGTPYCITVDHQTLEDNCVTLRKPLYHAAGACRYFRN